MEEGKNYQYLPPTQLPISPAYTTAVAMKRGSQQACGQSPSTTTGKKDDEISKEIGSNATDTTPEQTSDSLSESELQELQRMHIWKFLHFKNILKSFEIQVSLDFWHLAKIISNNFTSFFSPLFHPNGTTVISSVSKAVLLSQILANNSTLDDFELLPPFDYFMAGELWRCGNSARLVVKRGPHQTGQFSDPTITPVTLHMDKLHGTSISSHIRAWQELVYSWHNKLRIFFLYLTW